jgi:hypothetical protein
VEPARGQGKKGANSLSVDNDGRSPLPWKQRRTPKRGSRKSRNWRRIYPGYVFPDSVWTVTQGPYKRLSRNRSKSWVAVVCGDCGVEYERRLDHLVNGRSRRCHHCAPLHTKAWTHWARKREEREKEESTVGVSPLKAEPDTGLQACTATDGDEGCGGDRDKSATGDGN